jgi:phage-related protein
MDSFIWKGKDSYDDFGIVISELPPEIVPEDDIEEVTIAGRDGDLTIDNNAKKSYTLPMTCTLMDFESIEEVKAWLNGSGDLVFNWQSDFKYDARLNNKIDIAQGLEKFGEFPLIWKVQPYKKSISDSVISLDGTGTIYNSTGNTSKPIVKVFGTGSINLNINGNIINLTNVSEYIVIDSELVDAYKDTMLKNNDMNGEFPELITGANSLSWTGTVTKVEITPNWRYI